MLRLGLTGAVFASSLGVFWWHAAPSLTFHDSGELALAAKSAGIPHPPGAPTWTLLASAFVRLGQFGDAARGTNWFSGLCAAIALALAAWLLQRWTQELFPSRPKWLGPAAALTGVLLVARSPALLEQAFTTEQYALLCALLLAVVALADGLARPDAAKLPLRGCALGLAVGLAIGNHPSQLALLLIVVLALARHCGRSAARWLKGGASVLGGLALGLSVFLWLPWRSRANPALDWGNPETWEGFLWVIGRKEWLRRPISDAPAGFWPEWMASYDWLGQVGLFGLLLAAVGLLALARGGRRVLAWLVLGSAPYAVGMLLGHLGQRGLDLFYLRSYGVTDWHLPLYLALALAAGIGAAALLRLILEHAAPRAAVAFASVLLLIAFTQAFLSVRSASLRHFTAPARYLEALLAPLPQNAMVLPAQDNPLFMLAYRAFAEPGELWVARRPAQPLPLSSPPEVLARLATEPSARPLFNAPPPADAERRKLYVEYLQTYPSDEAYLLPRGFLFEAPGRATSDDEVLAADREWRERYGHTVVPPSPDAHRLEKEAWAVLHHRRGAFFGKRKLWPLSAESYSESLRWFEQNAVARYALGYALEHLDKPAEAGAEYERALRDDPSLAGVRERLAILHAKQGRLSHAEALLLEELALFPNNQSAQQNLAIVRKQMR